MREKIIESIILDKSIVYYSLMIKVKKIEIIYLIDKFCD